MEWKSGTKSPEYIGHHVQANIRELEGALTTIYAMAITSDEPVTLELAQRALEGQIKLATKPIRITDIIDVVTSHFDVRLADLQSKRPQSEHYRTASDLHVPGPQPDQAQFRGNWRSPGGTRSHHGNACLQ